MPELPEVETIMQGLAPHLENTVIQQVVIRHSHLRWPIPSDLKLHLIGQTIKKLSRRGKYLLIDLMTGTLIIHLGMSGSLRLLSEELAPTAHDHLDIIFPQYLLRYRDPRRFGAILWTTDNPLNHPLIKSLGLEPLDSQFTGSYLYHLATRRRAPIKSLIMNNKIITGVGNIYATEALFLAKINPLTLANQLSLSDCTLLVDAIKKILASAIKAGGTTLKDFVNSQGKPGYFSQKLLVYGRAKLPCSRCGTPLTSIQIAQRSTVFCMHCQPQPRKSSPS